MPFKSRLLWQPAPSFATPNKVSAPAQQPAAARAAENAPPSQGAVPQCRRPLNRSVCDRLSPAKQQGGRRLRPGLALVSLGVAAFLGGCAPRVFAEPKQAVDTYLSALRKGDVDAMYGMMSEASRRVISRAELQRIVADQKVELASYAESLSSSERRIRTQAAMRYDDGEIVVLELADGQFRLAAGDALPAAARSPVQALGQLRRVLARRSYSGLLQVLTPRTRTAMENELRSLVRGLRQPQSLRIKVEGDKATVRIPGGHQVTLKLRDGVWRVDDFQ